MQSLKALVEQRERPIDLRYWLRIVCECCSAVDGNVLFENSDHQISPSLILLSTHGEVQLAAPVGAAWRTIEWGYLSPECASGLDFDRRADVFALGVILWELLAGTRLYQGASDYQTIELVREARVPSVMRRNTEVDPELEAIVGKALAKDPANRYQRVAELGDALTRYMSSHYLTVMPHELAGLIRELSGANQQAP